MDVGRRPHFERETDAGRKEWRWATAVWFGMVWYGGVTVRRVRSWTCSTSVSRSLLQPRNTKCGSESPFLGGFEEKLKGQPEWPSNGCRERRKRRCQDGDIYPVQIKETNYTDQMAFIYLQCCNKLQAHTPLRGEEHFEKSMAMVRLEAREISNQMTRLPEKATAQY
ncbi:predicted protein [Uncinocarpus reesii 1704]|uniref:Uncharacterized protein n=1 Tax=Uncinocarpus reesii (strain UAMH 1704) TaxID=336963 RepID=C4JQZ4_UNCRE|nr:uncharacterized protein UREG_03476 [Uncinocarpus reesii 1704]EEP78630.1 predicted protein [Uncinocarpus reesii 1704]